MRCAVAYRDLRTSFSSYLSLFFLLPYRLLLLVHLVLSYLTLLAIIPPFPSYFVLILPSLHLLSNILLCLIFPAVRPFSSLRFPSLGPP